MTATVAANVIEKLEKLDVTAPSEGEVKTAESKKAIRSRQTDRVARLIAQKGAGQAWIDRQNSKQPLGWIEMKVWLKALGKTSRF